MSIDGRELLAIFVGGFIGAVARALLVEAMPHEAGEWPWSTFAANIAGSLLLGYVVTRLAERLPPSTYPRPFWGTGLCGALTTFSVMQLELVRMLEAGHVALALSYSVTSVVVGFACVVVATKAARRVRVTA